MTRLEHRFWSKVAKRMSGCWEWTASRDTSGYGLFKVAGRTYKAHRFAHILTWGDIRPGHYVLHACDNPRCVNPLHLSQGTALDNAHDRDRKGRWVRGRGRSALSDNQVLEIRRRAGSGVMQARLAEEFQITPTQVSRCVLRRTYAHV